MTASRIATRGKVPAWLIEAGIVTTETSDTLVLPGCPHGCSLDVVRLDDDRLVVECPTDPPCFEGFREVSEAELQRVVLLPERLARVVADRNGLRVGNGKDVDAAWCCGEKRFRDRRLFVYLTGAPTPTLLLAINERIRSLANAHALIYYGSAPDPVVVREANRLGYALRPLPVGDSWDFDLNLVDVYDALNPDYLQGREDNARFVFEDVEIAFAEEPGKRHILEMRGVVHAGFTISDKRFSRLLLLAAHRKVDPDVYNGGWVGRDELDLGGKGKNYTEILDALANPGDGVNCGLRADDLRLLVRTNPDNDGTIRLAVDPSNLTFDESLRSFAILNAPARRPTSKGGRERYHAGHNKDLKKGAKRASEFVARSLKLIGME